MKTLTIECPEHGTRTWAELRDLIQEVYPKSFVDGWSDERKLQAMRDFIAPMP